MYQNFYNFSALPFEISPDPKFLWLGEKHKEGLSALRYGILANAGFLSLTGDVGTGKTTLVNALANSLENNIIVAKIPDPYLKALDFFNFAANAFKMNTKFRTKGDFLSHLKNFLYKAHAAHKKVLLIIEEAQRLSLPLLEEVRLLSNIEKQNQKLINILFVGQNEFNAKLKKNRALKQRVTISYHIQPLTELETKAYMRHRLGIAGSGTGIFSPGAVHEVYAFSKGNPRLINVVCDLALLNGYTKETKIIQPQIIKDCAAEYKISDQKTADFIKGRITPAKSIRQTLESTEPAAIVQINQEVSEKTWRRPDSRRAASFALILLLIFSCFFGYLYYRGEKNASIAKFKPFLQQSLGRFTVAKPENLFPDRQIYKAAAAGSEMRILSDTAGQGQTSELMPDNNENHQNEIARLQSRLADLKSQRSAGEMQLSRLQSGYDALVLELKDLKNTQERVAELENVIAIKEQMLARFEQKLNELENHLNQEEKSSRDTFNAKLASKDAVVAELQEKLAASRTNQRHLVDKIARLKSQLLELKAHNTSPMTSAVILKAANKPPSESGVDEKEAQTPSPGDIIDWVLKKKAE